MNDKDAKRVETYLKRALGASGLAVKAAGGACEVQVDGAKVGSVQADEDEDGSYMFEAVLRDDDKDMKRVEARLKRSLGASALVLKARPKQKDSFEAYVGEEFLGVVYEDQDGASIFEMAILAEDLD